MFGYIKLQNLHALPKPGKMFIGHQQLTIGAFYCFEETVAVAEAAVGWANNSSTLRQ